MSQDKNKFSDMKDYFGNPKKVKRLGVGMMGLNILSEQEIKDLLGEEGESLLETGLVASQK